MANEEKRPPCPTCGRAAHDWKTRTEGTKGYQRKDREDRTLDYRTWHRSLPARCLFCDVDSIEWRVVDGVPQPAAVVELSRIDGALPLPESYLKAVVTRVLERDGQGTLIRRTAELLNVPAYLVLFAEDLTAFYIYELTGLGRWAKNLTAGQYRAWLEKLTPP